MYVLLTVRRFSVQVGDDCVIIFNKNLDIQIINFLFAFFQSEFDTRV